MKQLACVLYIAILFIYFVFDFGKYWGDVYLQLQCLMIAYLCHIQCKRESLAEHERLLFKFVRLVAIMDSIYTFACMINGRDFALYHTNIFAYIIAISVVVVLVHIAVNKDKFK